MFESSAQATPPVEHFASLLGFLSQSVHTLCELEPGPERNGLLLTARGAAQELTHLCAEQGLSDCAEVAHDTARLLEHPDAAALAQVEAALAYLEARRQDLSERAPQSPVAMEVDTGPLTDTSLAAIQAFQRATLRMRDPSERQAPVASAPAPPRHASPAASGTFDDLDTIPPEMKRTFLLETAEDLHDLRRALIALEEHPRDTEPVQTMRRIAHKVKGTAATFGFDDLAELHHSFEDLLKDLQACGQLGSAPSLGLLIRAMDALQSGLDQALAGEPSDPALLATLRALHSEVASIAAAQPAVEAAHDSRWLAAHMPHLPDDQAPAPTADTAGALLRVNVRQLDTLMSRAGALAFNRAALTSARERTGAIQADLDHALERLANLSAQLTALHPVVRSGAHPSRAAGTARLAQAAGITGWDDLELDSFTEFDQALRALHEAIADAGAHNVALRENSQRLRRAVESQVALMAQLQQDALRMRLVPLRSLVPRLRLAVRTAAEVTGIEVSLSTRGELIEIDRAISEGIADPLIQLVRNAVAHGIEPSAERLEHGKPAKGAIWIRASYSGHEVEIDVGDDGRGINPNAVAAAGVAYGLLDERQARALTPSQALDLIFTEGFSMFEGARIIAGHGIGLDSVRSAIRTLKGSITVYSEPGQGTIFRIRVPISLSMTRAFRVCVGPHQYALPFSAALSTLTVQDSELLVSLTASASRYRRRLRVERPGELGAPAAAETSTYEEIPVFSLAELLGHEETEATSHLAFITHVGTQRAAILVDQILGDDDVVIRALPAHLRRRSVRGAVITPGGQLLLLLDLPELLGPVFAGQSIPRPHRAPKPPVRPPRPSVLVVDDSISIRRALSAFLERAGYETRVAHDGLEALALMTDQVPDALILDIEMPRLDGFELLSILRSTPAYSGVRVAMLTSRAGEKHHDYAMALGADAYLTKPCPQDVLLATLQRLLVEKPVRV